MPVLLLRQQTVAGVAVPAGTLIVGLTPTAEAALAQGGDANILGPNDLSLVALQRITTAQLATLQGVPGVMYELIDGADRGVRLHWYQPDGEPAPTWCWSPGPYPYTAT